MKLAQNTNTNKAEVVESDETTGNTVTVTTSTNTNAATEEGATGTTKNENKKKTESTNSTDGGSTVPADTESDTENVPTATVELPNVSGITQGVDLRNPTWDVFLIGFFIVGALLYGMSLGKDRIISMMLSVYLALAIAAALPEFVLNVKVNPNNTVEVTAFVAVFVILFFLLSRWAVVKAVAANERGSLVQMITFGTLQVGLLVAVTLSFLPPNLLARFSDVTLFIFTNPWMYFAWIVAPIVAMIAVGKRSDG